MFLNNIIAQAEFRYQRHVIDTSRSGRGWILLALLLLLPALLMSLMVYIYGLGLFDADGFISNLEETPLWIPYQLGSAAFMTMNIALYPVVILITLSLSAHSITRERENRTWDILLLTHITARQLVIGKWWASLRALWGDHVMVALLRLGLIGLAIGVEFANAGFLERAPHILVLTVFMLAFTAIDAAFTAALGIAIPLSSLPDSVTTTIVLAVRVTMIVIAIVHVTLVHLMFITNGPYIVLALSGLLVGVIITWATLVAAQVSAVRGQVTQAA